MRTRVSLSVVCILLITPSASADLVGVTTVIKDDPDTEFLCTQGHGDFVPGPLTVCNVFAVFDDPTDRLLNVGDGQLQVFNAKSPDVFFHHPFNFGVTAPSCAAIPVFPDLICDSFVTIGVKCSDPSDGSIPDACFDSDAFNEDGLVSGGWVNVNPANGQGDAGNDPELEVLILQSAVLQGRHLSGEVTVFWLDAEAGETMAAPNLSVECAAVCPAGEPCEDGDPCSENDMCNDEGGCELGTPVDCDDGNECTDDACDPETGCTHEDSECPEGQICDPATGECVDPCECVNGKVTLCHIPRGNRANARTITVGCAARDKHLAHGDVCGPCEDGDG